MKTGLYIHVPFCVSNCRYCDFYKSTNQDTEEIELYLQALQLELGRLPATFAPETVFIGGGTPSILTPDQLHSFYESIQRNINLSNVAEFSSEVNPGTLSPEKLVAMKSGGVNRVSMGVQSFDSKALRLLGRIHTADQAVEGFHLIREAGIERINLDLIQSIPGMSHQAVLADARKAVSLSPEHISYYNLIYEPGTPMTADLEAGRLVAPSDDEEADIYFAVREFLEMSGYGQYETSNFCKPGEECQQNVLYWQGGDYLGCGPAAYSHWQGARYGNVHSIQTYADRLLKGERAFDEVERLSAEDKARETLVMGLRMLKGVHVDTFKQQTGFNLLQLCGAAIKRLEDENLLERDGDWLRLAQDALFISNSVFSELI